MNTTIQYIGVDVAKAHLDIDLPSLNHHLSNSEEGIEGLLKVLPSDAHLVCESTGGYESALVAAAHAAGVPISVLPPHRVRHHARSTGRYAKTDRLDAALLSDYGRKHSPAPCPPPQPSCQRLRELLRARVQLIELKKMEASWREHPSQHPVLLEQAGQREALLDAQLCELEREIRTLVVSGDCRAQVERLTQVQGIGEVTAWTVLAELPELGTLEPGQAGAISGLAPYARDSGQQRGKRFIQHGRPQLRRVLYMAAITAARCNPVLSLFYQRLRARGKPAKLALVAIARRLIELLNLIIKNPNFSLAK
jgi:transposase